MGNNPVQFVDFLGDTTYVFSGVTGPYVGMTDLDKKGQRGLIKTSIEIIIAGDKVTKNTMEYFNFNDPKIDSKAIRNGKINRLEVVSKDLVFKQLFRSGVLSPENEGIGYARKEGVAGGKMDYAIQGYYAGDLDNKTLYYVTSAVDGQPGSVAYNFGDFGNYLFGRGIGELGISPGIAKAGAHYNNIFNAYLRSTDYTPLYDMGPGTYADPGFFDSPADQAAITRGAYLRWSQYLQNTDLTLPITP